MPPKQAQESNSSYKPFFVLPIVLYSPNAEQCLRKPVNIKKNLDQNKVIQVLKEKGLQPFIQEDAINRQGRNFVCENYHTVCEQTVASINKPVDPKKDPKKQKKEAKKQQPAEEVQQPIEINFQKDCNDFYFLLDFPADAKELEKIIQSNVRVDLVVVIEAKVKPGSRVPDLSLLKNEKSMNDLENTLKNTIAEKVQDEKQKIEKILSTRKQIIEKFIDLRTSQKEKIKEGTLIIEVPYLNDLSKPETNDQSFINALYQKLCDSTLLKKKYEDWKENRKVTPMIQPLKEVVKKEVQVEDKKQDKGKKGGKPAEPVFETVEEVVETKYESLPENIKSDLKEYEKAKKISSTICQKKQSVFNNILDAYLEIFQSSEEQETAKIASNIKNLFESKPLNKVSKENLINRVRQICYPKDVSMRYEVKFDYPPLNSDVSFLQLVHKAQGNIESLKIQYLVGKMQGMISKAIPKIKWDFGNRQNIQKFSAQRITALINDELRKDPEIISGYLEDQGIKLLVLTRTNPPGRVLYHNNIFDWKVVPDFQNWIDNFEGKEDMLEKDEFYDYPCSECGNLAIKAKNMMPTDNTIIRDELYTVGEKRDNIIQFYQENSIFGMKKKNKKNIYWQRFENNIDLKAFQTSQKYIKKTEKIQQQKPKESQQKNEEENAIKEEEVELQMTQIWVKYQESYTVSFNPYPTIIWMNNPLETKRTFGSKGQITCYKKDGSIQIYYPSGSISKFKNGKWVRIEGNIREENGVKEEIAIEEIIEGETTIKIREDQTIFIEEKGNVKRIIFPDETEIYENEKIQTRQIKNPFGPLIRIKLPRTIDLNVIGFGSAFAYLGFKNILERSYDGFLYEFIDSEFTSHMYIEKFEIEEKQFTEEVRLLSFKDGSQIKILGQMGKIVYISPNKNQLQTPEYLNERWLQLFTTSENFGEGVYDVDLKNGSISTYDKESNRFKTKVGNPSVVNIAVSFSIDQSQQSSQNFPNGFHVPDQNYFLPPPNNSIPPRLFSINPDGSGVQYLSSDQIGPFQGFHVEEEYEGERVVKQYSRKKGGNKNYMSLTFTENVNTRKFGLPSRLKSQKTVSNLVPNSFEELEHQVVETIRWNSDFSRVRTLEEQIRNEIKEKTMNLNKLK